MHPNSMDEYIVGIWVYLVHPVRTGLTFLGVDYAPIFFLREFKNLNNASYFGSLTQGLFLCT